MTTEETKRLLSALEDLVEAQGISPLNDEQRCVVVCWWACGFLSNGGFQYLLEVEYSLAAVARCFKLLGFEAASCACDQVRAALFPGALEPPSRAARDLLLRDVDWHRFEAQLDIVYKVGWDDLERAIGHFMEAHPKAFGRTVS